MHSCNYKPIITSHNTLVFIVIFTLAISFLVTSYTSATADDFKQNSTNQTIKHHLSTSQLTATECEKNIFQALKKINDPELNINIVDLGLIKEIKCPDETETLSITIILTSPFCPYIKDLIADIRKTVSETAPNKKNTVIVDTKTRWKPSRMTKEGRKQLWGSE
ncbi:metal-sulfur cluster assembly factor [Desulfovibrio gilichinskyi]|uniref:Metal-sulfur cluster biosynthetic enzyme n=1 Tax=Desulfovibrio gilichinskyi TaxID=1519643 RepID=A0A1X7CUG9_9BACT|nr:metal-sulfur cluster assembly factor [Desulfovibrio gilichinskyi]SMF03070.1 Metal-sulfur cluster biosynthetic enzyme [Desulfovibrio gilichinskyi]